MANLSKSEIIKTKPIGDGLNGFRDSFKQTCQDLGLPSSLDSLHQIGDQGICQFIHYKSSLTDIGLKNLLVDLNYALQNLPAARVLPSISGRGTLRTDDLLLFGSLVRSDDFDVERFLPLLNAILRTEPDEFIWEKVYAAVTESTPPPRPLPLHIQQTPHLRNTSSFLNSSERRKYVDDLKEELGSL